MNRLAHESSPYLLQHANNPVDWYPWGQEALERARREDRPIHLSVGYSACHWCHVMAHESFEDPEIAAFLNEHFVNIKLDREERPDLDQLYQGVVQLMGRGGGWPLTVFLTPKLRPFYGGTYFPPEERHGLPGFPKVLTQLLAAWQQRRQEVESESEHFRSGLAMLGAYGLDAAPAVLSADDLVRAASRLEQEIDRRNGGFGGSPKFPNPACLALLLRGFRRTKNEKLSSAVLLSLEKMAAGGIYDQLGGGFHRYSVDDRWQVPHFEKMLYDNAQLLHLYAEAQQLSPRPLWKTVVEETVSYLQRELQSPNGAFYAAQDADSEGEEGRFFVWTPKELEEILGADLALLARAHFGVEEEGNFEGKASVLQVLRSPAALAPELGRPEAEIASQLVKVRSTLLAARSKRIAPGLDDKVLAGWNGLTLRGLAMAGRVFDREDWIALARGAADFVLEHLWVEGRLLRTFKNGRARIDGFLEDYGGVASGLVSLFQACFEPRYLEAAEAIVDRAVALFWDEEKAAYLTAPKGQADLLVPTYALHDSASPSGASSLTEAQVALYALTGHERHRRQAERYVLRMSDEAQRNPFGHAHLLLAADAFLDGAAELVVVGGKGPRAALLAAANGVYAPTVALCAIEQGQAPALLREALEGKVEVGGRAAAYLCRNLRCEAPILEAEELSRALS